MTLKSLEMLDKNKSLGKMSTENIKQKPHSEELNIRKRTWKLHGQKPAIINNKGNFIFVKEIKIWILRTLITYFYIYAKVR